MKKLIYAMFALPLLIAGAAQAKPAKFVPPTYEVPLSSVTVPVQCQGMTFAHAFVGPADSIVNGTSGNDLIFIGNDGLAFGNNGNDCIVGGLDADLNGGAGNDTLISGGLNFMDGGPGIDTAYFNPNLDAVVNVEHLHDSAF